MLDSRPIAVGNIGQICSDHRHVKAVWDRLFCLLGTGIQDFDGVTLRPDAIRISSPRCHLDC